MDQRWRRVGAGASVPIACSDLVEAVVSWPQGEARRRLTMSQQDDTTRLDQQEARMEDQERRLENGQPPRDARANVPTYAATTPDLGLDAQDDRMKDQERRLENDLPPRDPGTTTWPDQRHGG
jgi:hypothetical protein